MFVNKGPYYALKKQKHHKHRNNDDDDDDSSTSSEKIDISKILGFGGHHHSSGVSRHKNHIYFYDDVTIDSCLELNRELMHVAKELQHHSLDFDCVVPKIYLHINSYGGELLACFSTVDYIKNCPVPVVSIIEGCAASAATLISVVAKERYMTPSSWMLIHQLRGGYWGKFEDMEEDMMNNKKFMEKIYEIYEGHTKLTRKELKKILKKDEWWNLQTCIEYGLVDGSNTNDVPPPPSPPKKKEKKDKKDKKEKKDKKKSSEKKSSCKKSGISKKKSSKSKNVPKGVVTRSMVHKYGLEL